MRTQRRAISRAVLERWKKWRKFMVPRRGLVASALKRRVEANSSGALFCHLFFSTLRARRKWRKTVAQASA